MQDLVGIVRVVVNAGKRSQNPKLRERAVAPASPATSIQHGLAQALDLENMLRFRDSSRSLAERKNPGGHSRRLSAESPTEWPSGTARTKGAWTPEDRKIPLCTYGY